eukprot:XP_002590639.1 hypothetical protein BRAFLDRAFT_89439 [Branchiostoma floridae]
MFSGQKIKDINPVGKICKVALPTTLPVNQIKISTVSVHSRENAGLTARPVHTTFTTLSVHPSKISTVHVDGMVNSGSTARHVHTTLPVNLSKISTVSIDGQLGSNNSSCNCTTSHTSNYQWCFKQCSAARPVGPTFTPLAADPSKPENNSSHEPGPSFPLPVVIASVCGPVAGIVLTSALILTIWCKRRAKNPPSPPNSNIALRNTNRKANVMPFGHDQTGQGQSQAITEPKTHATAVSQSHYYVDADSFPNPPKPGAGPGLPPKAKSPVPPRKSTLPAPSTLTSLHDDDGDCVYVEPDGAMYMQPENVLYEMPADSDPRQPTEEPSKAPPKRNHFLKTSLTPLPVVRMMFMCSQMVPST